MTDGPHKSLPQKRPWKVLAQRTAGDSFSEAEVDLALDHALRSELAALPLDCIHRAFIEAVPNLFSTNVDRRVELLEATKESCRSAPALAYIDSMIVSAITGESFDDARRSAMCSCVDSTLHSSKLSTVEHYKAKGYGRDARRLSERWDQARARNDVSTYVQEAAELGRVHASRSAQANRSLDGGPDL